MGQFTVAAAASSLGRLPEAMARAGDEDVFQRRLAKRDRFDLAGKCLDQPRDPLVAVGLFQPHGSRRACCGSQPNRSRDRRGQAAGIGGANRDRVAADRGPQRVRRVERHQLPFVQNGDAVGLVGFFQQVGRQHDRHALLVAQRVQVVPQIAAGARVETGARLVEQQQSRMVEQPLGQLDAPPQPAGERLDPLAGAIGQPKPGEHLATRGGAARRADRPYKMPLVAEVFAHGQFLVEARRLKHDADRRCGRRRFARRRS